MSTLAFLHADHVDHTDHDGAGGPAPVSPLRGETEAAAAGGDPAAEAAACRETVGWADGSALGKLELQAGAAELAALRDAAGFAAPAPGTVAYAGGARWCPLTPTRALVLSEPAAHPELRSRMGAATVDVSASFAALTIAGPLARETFARFCALDLRPAVAPVGAIRPGSVARTPGLVLREAEQRYLLLFGAAYARYVWEVVADAGGRLGGRAVLLAALPPIATTTEVESHA